MDIAIASEEGIDKVSGDLSLVESDKLAKILRHFKNINYKNTINIVFYKK